MSDKKFQSTRPVRGATAARPPAEWRSGISIHAPRAGRDGPGQALRRDGGISIHAPRAGRDGGFTDGVSIAGISIHAPRAGRDPREDLQPRQGGISIHAPRAGRDDVAVLVRVGVVISIHAPRAGRDGGLTGDRRHCPGISIHAPRAGRDTVTCTKGSKTQNFNPRAPCGARRKGDGGRGCGDRFQSTRPVRGATPGHPLRRSSHQISIHAPRAGRDSKSIQNYFTHFCDKRQFLDNFTQNAAF